MSTEPEVIEIGVQGGYLTRERKDPALCIRCGIRMNDAEETSRKGEYWHYRGPKPCVNDEKYLQWGDGELQPWKSKGRRRAISRGARLASKHRG